ncbi:MAG TPA: hypothetical protein DIC18_01125 [Clostridiales bacterium]|nr:hypothetical protein [Clostridiales bacterium]HCU55918.1 hypothetical protein [Clostridiales bacterium]
MKKRSKQILALALIIIACAIVSELIVSQPILNKGIVVGMGIDKTEKGEVEVTVQIAVAGESSAPGAPNRYAVVSGEAPTLIAAMDKIARITAYKPAYFHCHILVLGERLVKEGVREIATQLFAEDSVMDDVAVMAVKGTAKETLERSVSMQGAASIYLQQLNKINSSTGGHPTATLKSFVTQFETKGYTPYLPWVEAVPVPKAIGGADTGGDEQNYVFDCAKTVLFDDGGKGTVESEKVTTAIGLTGQAEGMTLNIKNEKGFMDVFIKKSLEWWHMEKNGMVTLSVIYFVKVIATDLAESPKDLPDKTVESMVKEEVRSLVMTTREQTLQTGKDPFSLLGKYHKKYGEKAEAQNLDLRLKIKVKLSDA